MADVGLSDCAITTDRIRPPGVRRWVFKFWRLSTVRISRAPKPRCQVYFCAVLYAIYAFCSPLALGHLLYPYIIALTLQVLIYSKVLITISI